MEESKTFSTECPGGQKDALQLSFSEIVERCSAETRTVTARTSVLETFGQAAFDAQKATNCLTSYVLSLATQSNAPRLLEGVPITIKDCIDLKGHDTTVGYSRNAFKPAQSSAAIVRLLQDAGASLVAKTTNPTGLFGAETFSDLFGYTSNPVNPGYSSGASGGGGGALLALNGAVIDVGTDIGGSLRIPAHFCGVVGMRTCVGRFPTQGCVSSAPGLEGVPITTGAMARTVGDLEVFCKGVVECRPWKYDSEVIVSIIYAGILC